MKHENYNTTHKCASYGGEEEGIEMNKLQEFLLSQGAVEKEYFGVGGSLVLDVKTTAQDRFEAELVVFGDEPDKLFAIEYKLRGVMIVSEEEALTNHNNLGASLKAAYEKLVGLLKENNIEFKTNDESFYIA